MPPIRLDLPHAGYWIPMLIGALVGAAAILVGRLVFSRIGSMSRSNSESLVVSSVTALPERKLIGGPLVEPANKSTNAPVKERLIARSPKEQRQTPRREGGSTDVMVALAGMKDQPLHGWVVDRSLGGLCLSVTQEIEVGEKLSVLPAGAPPLTHWIEVEVKSCRPTNEAWEIGCQFMKPPPFSILMMFG